MTDRPSRPHRPQARALPRSSGVLLHLTSLPSPLGIGDLGPAAFQWIDQLATHRQTWWQFLPLTAMDQHYVPYAGQSAFAGEELLVSPHRLVESGLLHAADLPTDDFPADRVDYSRLAAVRLRLLDLAFSRRQAVHGLSEAFASYRQRETGWLDDYALFAALKQKIGQKTPWSQWRSELARRESAALATARRDLAESIERIAFGQFLFASQLETLRAYARLKGVRLLGDVPIYVSTESADVWAHPNLFQMTADLKPKRVSGTPPDCFCATGQCWRNPLYEWKAHQRDGFAWWIARMRSALQQCDLVRIDHFRALSAFWSIPGRDVTAERGRWVRAPGRALLRSLHAALGGLPVVAEDLGVITPDVEALRDEFGLPGMRVLHFGFGGDPGNPHAPHNHVPCSIAYTGTHDNDTTLGWHASLDDKSREFLHRYVPEARTDAASALVRLAWQSVARVAIAPMQDVLRLDASARMNTPGTPAGNWTWRMAETQPIVQSLERLAEWTETFERSPVDQRPPGSSVGMSTESYLSTGMASSLQTPRSPVPAA